jgi:hypothetical protein
MAALGELSKRGCPCGRGPAFGQRSARSWHWYCTDCGTESEEPAAPLRFNRHDADTGEPAAVPHEGPVRDLDQERRERRQVRGRAGGRRG